MARATEYEQVGKYVEAWRMPSPRQGSDAWFDLIYPVDAEIDGMNKVQERLEQEGRLAELWPIVRRWEELQLFFLHTEYGSGKKLPIQPPYQAELFKDDDGVRVFAFNLRDYGDQKESYVDFGEIDEVVRVGLERVYEGLATMQENEGFFRVSPSEFYTKFGSNYDVVEFYRIVRVREDGSREIEGRYLVLDRILTKAERLFLVNKGGVEIDVPAYESENRIPYSSDNLALNPQPLVYELDDDPILMEMRAMSDLFAGRFGRPLVENEDFFMYERIMRRVHDNIDRYMELLQHGKKRELVDLLKSMLFASQREWAIGRGIDPERHIQEILDGQFVVGFEIGFEGFDPVFDTFFGYGNEKSGYCFLHAEHYRGACPACSQLRRNWN